MPILTRGKKASAKVRARIVKLHEENLSVTTISRQVGIGRVTVSRILRQEGIEPTDHRFNDEDVIDHAGYVLTVCPPEFSGMVPASGKTRRVRKHRLVMAQHIGRCLYDYETVHHIDGDKLNNEIENLQLRIGRHGKGSAYECVDCGSQNVKPVKLK